MIFLSEHLKETADIVAGYSTGRLVIENGQVGIQRSNGEIMPLDDSCLIEIRNDDVYEQLTIEQALTAKTTEGWPLFAGLYARVKRKEE